MFFLAQSPFAIFLHCCLAFSSCQLRSMQKCSTASWLTVCTPACLQQARKCVSTHSLPVTIINHQCKHSIIHHFQCLPSFTAKSVRSIRVMFISLVPQNKTRIFKKTPVRVHHELKTQFEIKFLKMKAHHWGNWFLNWNLIHLRIRKKGAVTN